MAFPGKASCDRVVLPNLRCWVFYCFQNPPNSAMNYGIFNVQTAVKASDCTRGCTGHRKRVCAESRLWEKNPLPHRGIEPESAACRSDALSTELHPQPNDTVLQRMNDLMSAVSFTFFFLSVTVTELPRKDTSHEMPAAVRPT